MFSLFVHGLCHILVMSLQLLGLNRWSSFTVCNIWKGHSVRWLNTLELGRGEDLLNSCYPSGGAESQKDLFVPLLRWEFSGSCHSASLPRVLLKGCTYFFLFISNKEEMNVCGNRRGGWGVELWCCALSLTISPMCVLWKGYMSHQPPIMKPTDEPNSRDSGGFILMFGVTKLFLFILHTVAKRCFKMSHVTVLLLLDCTTPSFPLSFPAPPPIHLHHVDLSDCQCLFQLDST